MRHVNLLLLAAMVVTAVLGLATTAGALVPLNRCMGDATRST